MPVFSIISTCNLTATGVSCVVSLLLLLLRQQDAGPPQGGPAYFMPDLPKTWVYVDGFNLYHGAVQRTPYKWLNLDALCRRLLPKNDITKIKYFTARVRGRTDPGKPRRQELFLRALRTLPNCEIHFGHFMSHPCPMPLVNPQGPQRVAWVIKTEEKGSDVNLAVHLLNDAWRREYDVAVVVSNDSDLVEAIRIVRRQLHKTVGIVNPHSDDPKAHPSVELHKEADFRLDLHAADLAAAQFPPTIPGTNIHKPTNW